MTIVVFKSGILTITTPAWCATEITDAKKPLVQVYSIGSPVHGQANLQMSMEDFLDVIAEGGKIVDLRSMQAPKQQDSSK